MLKKGDLTNCNIWRGIAFSPSKIFTKILIDRFKTAIDNKIRKEQAELRKWKSCCDRICIPQIYYSTVQQTQYFVASVGIYLSLFQTCCRSLTSMYGLSVFTWSSGQVDWAFSNPEDMDRSHLFPHSDICTNNQIIHTIKRMNLFHNI